MEKVKERIMDLLEGKLEEEGLFFVDLKVATNNAIKLFVDADTNVKIEQCAAISRHLEFYLDNEGIVPSNYTLEVSSPGMSNPILVPRQYKKRIGSTLEVLKTDGIKIKAVLKAVNDEGIVLEEAPKKPKKKKKNVEVAEMELQRYEINYTEIKKSILQFKF